MSNINEKTGIPYGYISANLLNSELVDELLFGSGSTDLSYKAALVESGIDQDDDDQLQEFNDQYESDEMIVEGKLDGVEYRSSWLGGALNFWVFHSPVKTKAAACSPCVPGAGDLGSEGDYICYGVPADWKAED